LTIDYDSNWRPLRVGGARITYDSIGGVAAISGDVGNNMVLGLE